MMQRLIPHAQLIASAFFLFAGMPNSTSAQAASAAPQVSSDEYAVYQAVLDTYQFPKTDAHVILFNRTIKFGCGEQPAGIPLSHGCSFMAMYPNTPADIWTMLNSNWAHLPKSAWDSFEKQNSANASLGDRFQTSWSHMLGGEGLQAKGGDEWKSPNFELFFSRVGFNPDKTDAIVYVLLLSHADNVSTSGEYFRLRLNSDKKWHVDARILYFENPLGQAQ